MADEVHRGKVTLEELIVSTLAMTDAVTKLLIVKGIIAAEDSRRIKRRAGKLSPRAEAPPLNRSRLRSLPGK